MVDFEMNTQGDSHGQQTENVNNNQNGGLIVSNDVKSNGKVPHVNGNVQTPVNGDLTNGKDWKKFATNGNGLNNNQDEYTVDKTNGHKMNGNNGIAEKDPLTGHKICDKEPLDDITCGIGSCQPHWARRLASTKIFLVVFLLAWVFQGMYLTYFVSVITTIEKLFQINSRTIGMLLSFSEIGQICTSLFLTYYAGRGHRPRWIALGMILFAMSAFASVTPHFLYGDRLYRQIALKASEHTSTSTVNIPQYNLCVSGELNNITQADPNCNKKSEAISSDSIEFILTIFATSLLGIGVGTTAISTLGIPYIDDNVPSRDSPIYMAITIGVRILGPASGFILGSFCTRIYVDLSKTNFGIDTIDPKWIGAWWLGLLIVASCMALTSVLMFMFPKNLKGRKITAVSPAADTEEGVNPKKVVKVDEDPEEAPKFSNFPRTLRRLLKNDILMFRTASSVLHLLPVAGLYTFLPKYLESQFKVTTHDSALISGIGGILVMGIGIALSGIVITKASLSARSVAAWIASAALIYSAGMGILSQIGCPTPDFNGLQAMSSKGLTENVQNILPSCELNCNCNTKEFSPICGSDGITYFSSCHAGCSSKSLNETFSDCKCIPTVSPSISGSAHSGYCKDDCNKIYTFVIMFVIFVFVHSTSEVGSMMLIMRCTHPKDKTMAMGIIQFSIGLFGNIPCPIIYGAVIDSACKVWGQICGKDGYCALYDNDAFRQHFLGITSFIMALAFVMDVIVWYKAKRIDIDPESSVTVNQKTNNMVEDGKDNAACTEIDALNGEHTVKINSS